MIGIIKRLMAGEEARPATKDTVGADIALCVLLLEAAHADGECTAEEKEHVVETLAAHFGASRAEMDELISEGYVRRDDAVDIFQFTRYMNNAYSKEQKLEVMESVWRIILTDGRLEAHEDHFAHKLANLLRLSHSELIECKKRARQ
ncbi:MAG TPA: TerB family tellurite resistance protein [Desulfopila sp.]|nr:TerB family tellurite resistance protein [Desulfopila sp.]